MPSDTHKQVLGDAPSPTQGRVGSVQAHTPGPWHVSGKDDGPARRHLHIGAANSMMVLASMNEVHADTPANARLIAAAPELLGAAKRVARGAVNPATGGRTILEVDMLVLEAAVAKAEGRLDG